MGQRDIYDILFHDGYDRDSAAFRHGFRSLDVGNALINRESK